jgi:hypothetical protein
MAWRVCRSGTKCESAGNADDSKRGRMPCEFFSRRCSPSSGGCRCRICCSRTSGSPQIIRSALESAFASTCCAIRRTIPRCDRRWPRAVIADGAQHITRSSRKISLSSAIAARGVEVEARASFTDRATGVDVAGSGRSGDDTVSRGVLEKGSASIGSQTRGSGMDATSGRDRLERCAARVGPADRMFATPPDSPGPCEPGLSDDQARDPRPGYCPELSPRATRSSSS